MKFNLVMDLEEKYIAENQQIIAGLAAVHNIISRNITGVGKADNLVVLTDSEDAAEKWRGYAVIGIEHKRKLSGIMYVVEELEDVDEGYISLVYHRKHRIPMTIMETEHLILRELLPKDAKDLCELYKDKEATQYITPVHEVSEEKEYMEAYARNMYGFYGYGMWGVVRKRDNKLIGRAGIEHRTLDGEVFCELGYFIGAKYQQKGYGFSAAQAVLQVAEKLGVEELIAYINEKNTPSIKLAQKLRFRFWKKSWDGETFLVYRIKTCSYSE